MPIQKLTTSTACGSACMKAAGEMPSVKRDTSRSEEHTSELQSLRHLVCRLLLEKKKKNNNTNRCHQARRSRLQVRRQSRSPTPQHRGDLTTVGKARTQLPETAMRRQRQRSYTTR